MDEIEQLEQFKTAKDLENVIKELIGEHRDAKKNKIGVMFRIVIPPNSPTTYEEGHQGKDRDASRYQRKGV